MAIEVAFVSYLSRKREEYCIISCIRLFKISLDDDNSIQGIHLIKIIEKQQLGPFQFKLNEQK